jgi:hypothetical protein
MKFTKWIRWRERPFGIREWFSRVSIRVRVETWRGDARIEI